jgi:putative ATP-dependent endonuclease of OLD family
MFVTKVHIVNYRAIRESTVEFKNGVNVVVGDNEAGKSTLLEALHLALTGRLGGRSIRYQLHPFLFNTDAAREFADALAANKNPTPPEILIEVYFDDDDDLVRLRGSNNTRKEEATGVSLRIKVAEACTEEFAEYVNGAAGDELVPIEFFDVEWQSFAYAPLSTRAMPFKSRMIDTAGSNAARGAGRYLSQLVEDQLSTKWSYPDLVDPIASSSS